jgi:hypothetical protein
MTNLRFGYLAAASAANFRRRLSRQIRKGNDTK